MNRLLPYLLIASGASLVTGCGPTMGQVHGKITFQGKPVTGGSVNFAPKAPDGQFEAGRPASAAPDANGEFQLSTNTKHDGAQIGPHVVMYLAPTPPRGTDAEALNRYKQFGNLRLPPGHVVEVKPGRNDITLELEPVP